MPQTPQRFYSQIEESRRDTLTTIGPRVTFLGTGASGGTPGEGRTGRTESSVLVESSDATVLIDVSGDFEKQAKHLERVPDAILLTHAHRDAMGGIAALGRWMNDPNTPLPLYATEKSIDIVRDRFSGVGHCDFRVFEPGDRLRVGDWTVSCHDVPHAANADRFPTVGWKLTVTGHRVVYAPDVASPTPGLREFARHAGLLIIDGATCGRRIFTHLRIEEDLPAICGWPVERILLTQIGRSCPPHSELGELVERICERAAPAHDGMVARIPN